MGSNINTEIEVLQGMTVPELREKYREAFGEDTRSYNKAFLWKRIAWRLQATERGDISERARRRAQELASDADLRVRAPRGTFAELPDSDSERTTTHALSEASGRRLPMPGTVLTRKYEGELIRVTVLEKGFEYKDRAYRSLSGVARAITGTNWNGFVFFGLNKKGGKS